MIEASSSTAPRTFGLPPRPTLVSSGSASTILAQASTASRAEPPRARMRIPAAIALAPFPLATMTGTARGTRSHSQMSRLRDLRDEVVLAAPDPPDDGERLLHAVPEGVHLRLAL